MDKIDAMRALAVVTEGSLRRQWLCGSPRTIYDRPMSARSWVISSKGSDLNPAYTGNFPNLDFGWYTYNGMTHQLNAKPVDGAKHPKFKAMALYACVG